jgi:hypothetical protein
LKFFCAASVQSGRGPKDFNRCFFVDPVSTASDDAGHANRAHFIQLEVEPMTRRITGHLAIAAGFLCALPSAEAAITVYNNLPAYQAAVGPDSLYVDFETSKLGGPVVFQDANVDGIPDVLGDVFSNDVTYSTPNAQSPRVNINDVDQGVDNEIGPYGTWDGVLRWDYTGSYKATGFTGVEVESSSQLRLYDGNTLVGSTLVGGSNLIFEFFGFLSTVPFNRAELEGSFYAIDAHRSTRVPEPSACVLMLMGLGTIALRRRSVNRST